MRATINGVDIAYDDQGGGLPVLLVHGFPFSRRMWELQAELTQMCRLITPDLRGFGESAGTPETVERLADDLYALAASLRLGPFVLGGFSMGGYVVFRYLAKHMGDVKAVMLLDTRAEADAPEARERRYASIDRVKREGPAGYLDDFLNLLVSPRTLEVRPEVVTAVRRLMSEKVDALVGGLRAMADRPDSTGLLSSITVPTLIVVGEDDKATPVESSRKMAAAIRGAQLVIVPGAGHVSNIERPGIFNAAVATFLSGLS